MQIKQNYINSINNLAKENGISASFLSQLILQETSGIINEIHKASLFEKLLKILHKLRRIL